MSHAIYVSISKHAAGIRHLDVIANNVANAETTGFMKDQLIYKSFLFEENLKNKVAYVNDIATYRDKQNGAIKVTSNPLDLALQGPGYFAVQTPQGTRYTRSGNFKINRDYQLSDSDSNPVLDIEGKPIIFEQTDSEILIDDKGNIRSSEREIGKLSIVKFANDNKLRRAGNNKYISAEPEEAAIDTEIIQYAIESSNVESVVELTEMINLQRNYELVASLINLSEKLEQKSVDDLAQSVK